MIYAEIFAVTYKKENFFEILVIRNYKALPFHLWLNSQIIIFNLENNLIILEIKTWDIAKTDKWGKLLISIFLLLNENNENKWTRY